MTVTPQARAADSDVDLVVYVTVEVVKPEDREAIAATRRPVVAVLNKADLAGPLSGAGPIVMAQARCAQFSTLLGVPMESMIGLLAVAALDDLDDTLRAALRALAAHPDGFDALDRAVAGFLAAALPVPTEVRLRLLDTDVGPLDDPAAHLPRAVRWHRYSLDNGDMHRTCGADIARGSLRLWSLAGGMPLHRYRKSS